MSQVLAKCTKIPSASPSSAVSSSASAAGELTPLRLFVTPKSEEKEVSVAAERQRLVARIRALDTQASLLDQHILWY